MMTKAQAERRHFQKRAMERLGIAINRDEIEQVVAFIQGGGAEFIERSSNSRTVWGVRIKGCDCAVVYDKRHKTVVTVLTRNMVAKWQVKP